MAAKNVCERCGEALRRRTAATSKCSGCGLTFYVDSADGRPIRRLVEGSCGQCGHEPHHHLSIGCIGKDSAGRVCHCGRFIAKAKAS